MGPKMHHAGIVVDDMEAATAFFIQLGLRVGGEGHVEGEWVDRVLGLEGVKSQIVMLEAPDGSGRTELSRFDAPGMAAGDPAPPSNASGLRHLSFEVEDLDAALAGLSALGSELVGEVQQYADVYRVCYLRGPAGVIVELAERVR